MKNQVCVLMGVLCAVAIVGCGPKQEGVDVPVPVSKSEAVTIAVIPKSTGNEFWETVKQGADRAVSEIGFEMRWEGTVTETEIAEQNKIIENMVNLGVAGIALAPLNERATSKKVQQAVDAGIPVVVFDSRVDGDAHSSFVATDNRKGGSLGCEEMVRLLQPGDSKGRVMVMRFVQGTGSTEARAAGFIESANAAGLDVLADPYPETGTIEGSKNVAVNTLEGFVKDGKLELDGIFACNLIATLGVASALDDLRKGGVDVDVSFVGFDTSKKLIQELQEGNIDALIAQNPENMGYLAVQTLAKVIRGEDVPKMTDTGVTVVSREAIKNDPAVRKLIGLE